MIYSKALCVALTTSSVAAFARGTAGNGSFLARQAGAASVLNVSGGAAAAASTTSTSTFSTLSSMDTPVQLPDFASKEEYLEYMESVSTLPKGFATGTAKGTFVSKEAPALGNLPVKGTVIYLTEGPTENWAAVFTKNRVRTMIDRRSTEHCIVHTITSGHYAHTHYISSAYTHMQFPGAPIIVGKSRIASGGPLHALVINNKVSNVCSGGDGVADSELVCDAVAAALKLPGGGKTVLPSSTGVIGWRLPAKELAADVVPAAIANLQTVSGLNAATAIMTTDRFPKVRSKTLSNGARLVGIAKGAGMIEPNMATMLSYLLTDADIPKAQLQAMLTQAVNGSYNSISVDGDESTSDTVALIASNQVTGTDQDEFKAALMEVCQGLSADIVRNGEGTSHVIKVDILNFPGSELDARRLGRHIVNSPLFKCAVSGNDPNTGRLAAAIGSFMGKFKNDEPVDQMTLTLGGRVIFSNGKFVLEGDAVEQELSDHMEKAQFDEHADYPAHQRFVEIVVDFGDRGGKSSATVLGSDLTGEYVVVNADYRS
jgi:glutamate N-acetyltransferase/amino-acid N-acetyltransferase